MKRCESAIVKIGGSYVTIKKRPYTINWSGLHLIASQIKLYISGGGKLALVHGGGSFGHQAVREALNHQCCLENLGVYDIVRIQEAMIRLSMSIYNVLRAREVPVTLHTTHTFCSCRSCNYDGIIKDFNLGLVPMAFGDIIYCEDLGITRIISGDKLVSELSLKLPVDCVIFIIDKPGIIDPNGRLLQRTSIQEAYKIVNYVPDYTGGLRSKLSEIERIPPYIRVVITSGDKLYDALRGADVGTEIVR